MTANVRVLDAPPATREQVVAILRQRTSVGDGANLPYSAAVLVLEELEREQVHTRSGPRAPEYEATVLGGVPLSFIADCPLLSLRASHYGQDGRCRCREGR